MNSPNERLVTEYIQLEPSPRRAELFVTFAEL